MPKWLSSPVGLGDLPDGSFSSDALAVSGDGSIVVGLASTASGAEAFLWTEAGGMVNLRDYLIAGGATGLTGWRLSHASAISADGLTIAGRGQNPDGFTEAWVATIAVVPEPSTGLLALCGLAGLLFAAGRGPVLHRARSTRRVRVDQASQFDRPGAR